ncbi:hypothetical protein HPB52_001565 [Rhipicephalus sanguineus]|uniref:Uncharacterized protein n=1 Tax=Rhipicephalus sanguineus TaxID=34632 RepID=A0A9D4PHI0_RHISA|nr:hypothetical protein HPB52_001565 [Rhipicephalus sanguineus]
MTTSSTPTYAYVKYHDGAKAIVHVSLIKKYSPSSVDDLAKKKMVYWCSTSSQEAKHSDEDFYMADVVELGLTKGDLIRRLVHLGNGVWVEKERWELLLGRDRDSLFCKELAKLVWGVPALRGRSVTGAPCRRYLKEGNAIEKPALSPHKLEAIYLQDRSGDRDLPDLRLRSCVGSVNMPDDGIIMPLICFLYLFNSEAKHTDI